MLELDARTLAHRAAEVPILNTEFADVPGMITHCAAKPCTLGSTSFCFGRGLFGTGLILGSHFEIGVKGLPSQTICALVLFSGHPGKHAELLVGIGDTRFDESATGVFVDTH